MGRLLPLLLGLGAGSIIGVVMAQPARYPVRPIEVIVAYGPGGSTDLVARALAQKLHESLGQPTVVLNKPGGSGMIGATLAARAAPDGYTLYVGYTAETVVVPQISRSARYSLDDFEPNGAAVCSHVQGSGDGRFRPGQLERASCPEGYAH